MAQARAGLEVYRLELCEAALVECRGGFRPTYSHRYFVPVKRFDALGAQGPVLAFADRVHRARPCVS